MRPLKLHVVALSLVMVGAPGLASADVSPGDRDLIRDRQERLLKEQQKRLEELQQLLGKGAEAGPPAPVEEGRCFDIRRIDLQGADTLSPEDQQRLLEPYTGRCLGVAQLNELFKVITDHYLDRGFVTSRAYLPQQDLSDGQLDIIVVEGKLEGLDSSSIASDRELAMAFPGRTGELLNLRELERTATTRCTTRRKKTASAASKPSATKSPTCAMSAAPSPRAATSPWEAVATSATRAPSCKVART